MKRNIRATVLLGGTTILAAYLVPNRAVSNQSNPPIIPISDVKDFDWAGQRFLKLVSEGMEGNSAGFHALRPWHDSMRSGMVQSNESINGMYWWEVYTVSEDGFYTCPVGTDVLTSVSYKRAFSGGFATYQVVANGSGSYGVEASFSPRAVGFLGHIVGVPVSTLPYVDWFKLWKDGSEEPTDYRVCVVSDNLAYEPFSIRSIAMGSSPDVIIAKNLSISEANNLMNALNE